ncbi:epimerase [Streptomyces hygroscopicus]|nr:epimerase [Streptomyces hygroscopicus]
MNGSGLPVTIMSACRRAGRGGSPTAVLDETALSNDERCMVPVLTGTSHAVFVSAGGGGCHVPEVSLRFFTATGELPACGHGTVAALAFLAEREGGRDFQATVRTAGRTFTGRVTRVNGQYEAAFELGPVDVREPASGDSDLVLHPLGVAVDTLVPGIRVATLGRPRLLVPVSTRSALATLAPDFDRLRAACDRLGLLGCYVYCTPTAEGRTTARMFAPSIGVPEDVANANSTACLAAHLAREGRSAISVDMGDALGIPSTITAAAWSSEAGPRVRVGGTAAVVHVVRL